MLSIALAGFGTVGQGVVQLLLSRGGEIRLTHICERELERKRAGWVPETVTWTDRFDHLLASDADVIVELIGGLDPARGWIAAALDRGKSVVTANKQVLAHHAAELFGLAAKRARALGFEASVAGGVPVIRAIRDGLAGDQLTHIAGILNGTCNYVLTRMEAERLAFDEVLRDAQVRGFAEADPTDDVEGFDARAKICILARVGLGLALTPGTVSCRSIRPVTDADFAEARRAGCTIRQVSRVELGDDRQVSAWVRPAMVGAASPLARVHANQNMVITTGLTGGDTGFFGFGAGAGPTSVAVLSDIIEIAERGHVPPPPRVADAIAPQAVSDRLRAPHYVRLVTSDHGAPDAIVDALARRDVTLQDEPHDVAISGARRSVRSVAFITAPADSTIVDAAISTLRDTAALVAPLI